MSDGHPSDGVCGIILAGGRSSRMGEDKALVTIRGRSLLDRVVERLRPQCGALVISRHDGRLDGAADPLPDRGGLATPRPLAIVADGVPGRAGPLAGLLAGLDWVAAIEPTASHAVSVAVDIPFLPLDFLSCLVRVRDAAGVPACCARSGDRLHPVAALWPVAARDGLRSLLAGGGPRRADRFLEGLGFAEAAWPIEPFDPFFNVNTMDDVAAAEAIALRHDRS